MGLATYESGRRASMIVPESEAWQICYDNADRFLRLEAYSHGDCRIFLEGEDPGEKPSGVIVGEQGLQLPEKLEEINSALIKKGWPDISPWWRQVLARAYLFPRLNYIMRVGRRGGKSSTMCRVAVYECLFGDHVDSQGDPPEFAILSAERSQAKKRVVMISKICEALGIADSIKILKETITFHSVERQIQVFTASLTSVLGSTCIGALCDEEAFWINDEDGSNPAEQILEVLRPTTATQPNAKIWHISAPFSTLDAHAEAFDKGTNKDQVVFYAPTWVANPTLTEERTHSLEPDEETWNREYKAVPQPSDETKFFAADTVDNACKNMGPNNLEDSRVLAGGDFAFRKDSSSLVIGRTGRFLKILTDKEWTPTYGTLSPDKVIGEALEVCETQRADTLCCDLHYIETVADKLAESDIGLQEFCTQHDDIVKAFIRTRVLLSQGRIDLSRASPRLAEQLKAVTSKPTGTSLTIEQPRSKGHHGDLVSALVCLVWAADMPPGPRVVDCGRRLTRRDKGRQKWSEFAEEDEESEATGGSRRF
jgi:hypothetical protein